MQIPLGYSILAWILAYLGFGHLLISFYNTRLDISSPCPQQGQIIENNHPKHTVIPFKAENSVIQ